MGEVSRPLTGLSTNGKRKLPATLKMKNRVNCRSTSTGTKDKRNNVVDKSNQAFRGLVHKHKHW